MYYNENWTLSFWTYLAVRLILDLLRASSLMLFEGAVIAIIKSYGGDYGLQKLFGNAGAILFGPLAGNIRWPMRYLLQHYIFHPSAQAFSLMYGITLGPFICTLSSGNFIHG